MKTFRKIAGMFLSIVMVASLLCAPTYADDAPAYTETNSTKTAYADAAVRWGGAPTITETIGYREKRNVTLATSYWARKSDDAECAYSSAPTKLDATFISGEGLLEFEVYLTTNGPIWSGTELEVLRIIPTDAALNLTEDTTVTGTVAVDWCGEKDMPFSVTITAPGSASGEVVPAKDADSFTVTACEKEDYARAATGWNAPAPTVSESIGRKERLLISMCTSYWANTGYTGLGSTPVLKTPVFTSGDGLLAFEVYIGPGTIWGGTECMLLRITPTDAAQSITETTLVTGNIPMYWCGDTNVPFSITLLPQDTAAGSSEQTAVKPAADAENFTVVGCTNTDYAGAATGWNVPAPTVTETVGQHERLVISMCTSYWANAEYTGINGIPALKQAVFTSGDGLLAFEVYIGAGPIWDGAECMLLRVTPSDAAQELTEDTIVTGCIPMYWCGETNVPFSITIEYDENHVEPGETEEYTETNDTTETYARATGFWGESPEINEIIGCREKLVVALASSYWARKSDGAPSSYSSEPTKLNANFTTGEGLLDFEVYIGAGPIWDGTECELLRIIPTDAAMSLKKDTTVTGTIAIDWCGEKNMPFSITVTAPEPVTKEVGELYISALVGDDITAQFTLETEDEYDSVDFIASLGSDEAKTIAGTAVSGGYIFEYTDIYSQRMTDVISGKFIGKKSGEPDVVLYTLAKEDSISIASYCDMIYDDPTLSHNEDLLTFIANMLEFGAASQTYTNYNTSDLANAASWVQTYRTQDAIADPGAIINNRADGAAAGITSANLLIENKITAEFTFITADIAKTSVAIDGVDATAQVQDLGNGRYKIVKEDLGPVDYNEAVVVEVSYDSAVVNTLEYSVNNYLYRMSNYSTKLSPLLAAIYNYGTAAEGYNG